jgi:phosphotransferase system enzyme I (PtsI)
MARSLEIPAVVSLRDISRRVRTGDEILIDGNKGTLIVGPTREQLAEYGKVSKARRNIEEDLSHLRDEPAVTPDGRRIILSANVESGAEADSVEDHGAEGIGLFRTEYLYLTLNRAVGEDEQAGIYRKVAERLAPHPVIIRTLDLGGDKFFGGGEPVHEPNPFLGCRSIRLSLQHVEHFKAQLRAILRASVCGNVKVMYPMISGVGEVVRANEVLAEAKSELRAAGVPFDDGIETGVMIEIPSAALTADAIAEHAHFFSIGTNDLIQYTIAVDRVNERVAYLYAPTHPAVLKLIRLTVEAAHRRGIWVGVCGEMAADPLMTPLLLGMDVDELSVAPVAVPVVKDAIRSIEYGRARRLVEEASADPSPADILSRCRQMLREVAPEILELT